MSDAEWGIPRTVLRQKHQQGPRRTAAASSAGYGSYCLRTVRQKIQRPVSIMITVDAGTTSGPGSRTHGKRPRTMMTAAQSADACETPP
ncbi:MAG: hypothetical protein OXE84_11355 [Rhodobacteraceae bacterium]|nr:hypothetical protein [Paracoccaceae bacterium]MCY4198173.1 hypothetical protein [Paracoccaceae bacterium]MCY4327694.1 hypothetical protein [Paracoccaceae bacterium]